MKKILLLLFLILPLTGWAQEILGKKKKYIDSVKPNADLIVDTPEMSIWDNKAEGSAGAQYLICYFKDEKCYKTQSIYPETKLAEWQKILDRNCKRVTNNSSKDKMWFDEKRKMFFKLLPGENRTFALESTKSNE